VDGRVGFTGGMNIRQRHFRESKDGISDIHFQVQGPIVLALQEVFLEDWFFATGESIPWLAVPHELFAGNQICRVISGGPNEDFEKIHWILLGALAWAKKKVRIMTPYFVPDRVIIAALNTAALRGVRVEVILPERNNLPFVSWASRALLWEMLEKDVRFFLQPPPFHHGKLFIVDDTYTLIGSSNWDSRSLRLNFELDLEIYGGDFAATMGGYFEGIKASSRELILEEIRRDAFWIRLRNASSRLFSPYL
jgi:cardiolipin synthase